MEKSCPENTSLSNVEVMPSRQFTVNEIITICSSIADNEDIAVQMPTRKSSLLRRLSQDITLKLKPGTPENNSDSDPDQPNPEALNTRRKSNGKTKSLNSNRMEVVKDSKIVKDVEKPSKENIPGLGSRDVVAIAILVDNEGMPMKTYTEHEDIPSEEYDAANQVYISRVPFREEEKKSPRRSPRSSISTAASNIKRLSDVLGEDIDVDKANKLKKRMEKVLRKLHTTDLRTAQSFLKLDRFENVRKDIARELVNFVEKDMKMNVIIEDDDE